MNIKCIIIILLIFIKKADAQDPKFRICATDSVFINFSQKKILFIGESHNQPVNFKLILKFSDFLINKNVFPKYILLEDGPSDTYLINKYLQSGNDSVLQIIEEFEESRDLYKSFRNRYLQIEPDKRPIFSGIDLDQYDYITIYAFKDILLKHKINCEIFNTRLIDTVSLKRDSNVYFYDSLCDLLNLLKLSPAPEKLSKKAKKDYLKKIYQISSSDSISFKKFLEEDYDVFMKIINSYKLNLSRKRVFLVNENEKFQVQREIFMTNNVYELFMKDTSITIFGQIGMFHALKKDYTKKKSFNVENIRLAKMLNESNKYILTNNKISSSIIIYKNIKSKKYDFLQLDIQSFFDKNKNYTNCEIIVQKVSNKKVDNLIFEK